MLVDFLSNLLFSTVWDVIFGTLATLIAAYFTYKSRHLLVAPVWPILFNGLIIGTMLTYMIGTVAWLPWLTMVGEVTMEVLIPLVMANLYDFGVCMQDMTVVILRSVQLVMCAVMSLLFGMASAVFASKAATGFAKNLRHDMFYRVQNFDFANIDKFSTASIITRITSDVATLQMCFQMMIRMAIRCPSRSWTSAALPTVCC